MGVRVEGMRVGGVMAAVAGMVATGGTMRLARVMAGVFLLLVLVATGAEGSAFCWSCSSSEGSSALVLREEQFCRWAP